MGIDAESAGANEPSSNLALAKGATAFALQSIETEASRTRNIRNSTKKVLIAI